MKSGSEGTEVGSIIEGQRQGPMRSGAARIESHDHAEISEDASLLVVGKVRPKR